MKHNMVVLLLIIVLVLSACTDPSEELNLPEGDDSHNFIEGAYPISDLPEMGYPIANDETIIDPSLRGPDFFINEPVRSGDTVVTGSGPANVPIILVNVSFVGEVLGETTIDEAGNFVFEIDNQLEANHSIGLQLGDITGTDFTETQFLYNENYYERPLIGVIFFMTTVTD